jgi:hypothetical protein
MDHLTKMIAQSPGEPSARFLHFRAMPEAGIPSLDAAHPPNVTASRSSPPHQSGKPVLRLRLLESLQLRVLGSSLPQDRDVGFAVFPEGEEIFVGGEGASAGEGGIRSLRGLRL